MTGWFGKTASQPAAAPAPSAAELRETAEREARRRNMDLDREIAAMQQEDARLISRIKAAAAQGNTNSVKTLATTLAKLRKSVQMMENGKSTMAGISTQLAVASATMSMGQTLSDSAAAMAAMNKQMNPEKIKSQVKDFAKETSKMARMQEMLDGGMNDVFNDSDTEAETDELVNAVFDEIGLDLNACMGSAPKGAVKSKQAQGAKSNQAEMSALMAQLGI